MRDTQIIIPCYNEARRLRLDAFVKCVESQQRASLLFVDDGSLDETWECLQELQEKAPRSIRLMKLPENHGKAEAVRLGMQDAMRQGAANVGFWDADLATPLEAIPLLIDVLDRLPKIDMVFGTRMRLLGRRIQRRRGRGRLGQLFAVVASNMLGIPLRDTQCGAKLFRTTEKLQLALAVPFSVRWIFDVELIARFIHLERGRERRVASRIFEFPLDYWEDVKGSKLRLGDFLKAPGELLSIYWKHLGPARMSFPAQAESALEASNAIVPFVRDDERREPGRRRDAA
jgi:glycosyltransferase involved in cell wall biosynthesis